MTSVDNFGSEEYIEIFGETNDIFYATMKNAIEATRIVRINHKRKIYVLPVNNLVNMKLTLVNREIYVKINGKIFRVTEPPNIDWFIDRIMGNQDVSEKESVEISFVSEDDRSIFGVQEILF